MALWATLPQWSGPALNTEPIKEVVDHIFPGAVVALASVAGLAVARGAATRPARPSPVPFFAGLAILLAGFWMVATHVPLLGEAFRDQAPWPATIYHSSAAFAVFGFGLLWTVAHWSDLAALESTGGASGRASAAAREEPEAQAPSAG